MFPARYFGARYYPPRYFGNGPVAGVAVDYFGNEYFPARYFGPYYWGNPGATTPTTTDTNSGVQRLKAFQDREAHYREVRRREALQVQQIRLAELQQQQQEIEAKRIADEALRKAAETRRPKTETATPASDGLDDRISALVRELAEVTGAVAQTKAEIARLDAIEAHEAPLAEQAIEDESILILAASI